MVEQNIIPLPYARTKHKKIQLPQFKFYAIFTLRISGDPNPDPADS